MAIINHGKVLAAGTVKGLKESDDETLEDVFIRLVGHSIEEAERISVMKAVARRSDSVGIHSKQRLVRGY